MSDNSKIPVLTDLIPEGDEITMSDLGLEEDPQIGSNDPSLDATEIDVTEPDVLALDPFIKAALEQSIRRILDEHMELAMQEIKLVIQREIEKTK